MTERLSSNGVRISRAVTASSFRIAGCKSSVSCACNTEILDLYGDDAVCRRRRVGDKIELTVTIVAREHYHHGR